MLCTKIRSLIFRKIGNQRFNKPEKVELRNIRIMLLAIGGKLLHAGSLNTSDNSNTEDCKSSASLDETMSKASNCSASISPTIK